MQNGSYIAYYRVSTNRQGESGLGLEAQRQAVSAYLNGGNAHIIQEFTEIESGKRNNRPKLEEAIATCKRLQATLIIAKLDRLARNVHFISGLMESGVKFIATDNPNADRLTLHMLATFAEHEREMISKRTCEALQAAKQRGVKLGQNGKALAKRNHDNAVAFSAGLRDIISAIRADGYTTTRAICQQLNLRQIPTAGGVGRRWHVPTVHKVLKRINAENGIIKQA